MLELDMMKDMTYYNEVLCHAKLIEEIDEKSQMAGTNVMQKGLTGKSSLFLKHNIKNLLIVQADQAQAQARRQFLFVMVNLGNKEKPWTGRALFTIDGNKMKQLWPKRRRVRDCCQ